MPDGIGGAWVSVQRWVVESLVIQSGANVPLMLGRSTAQSASISSVRVSLRSLTE